MTHIIDRRKALAVVAAVPAAALGGLTIATGEPGEMAALVRRYFAELDAFTAFGKGKTDEEADAFAAATYEATMERMVGVPARTSEDALAALDWLIEDGADLDGLADGVDWSPLAPIIRSLVDAIRGYIAAQAVA
jgi:hypothetical protein